MTGQWNDMPAPMPKDPSYAMPQRDDGRQGPYFLAEVTLHEDHLKHGTVGGFSVRCDEGERLGGTDTAPTPLSYFSVAVGFWLATQLVQVARGLKIEFRNVNIKVHGLFSREGSVLGGDIQAFADSMHTELSLDSDEPPERVKQLVKLAEASCFTIAALRKPTPVDLSVTVNGEAFELED